MKVLAQLPDAERAVVDYLTAALAARGNSATVGVAVPSAWAKNQTPFVQVGLDGTPEVMYPVVAYASVRITAWATNTTDAKSLVNLCEGLLLSYMGDRSIAAIKSLSGVLPTRDPDTKAQLATIAVRVALRYVALT